MVLISDFLFLFSFINVDKRLQNLIDIEQKKHDEDGAKVQLSVHKTVVLRALKESILINKQYFK